MNMKKLLISTWLLLFFSRAVQPQVILPHCQESCGDVQIPYPFGIQDGCFLNTRFQINCSIDTNDSSPKPLWGTLTVVNISVEDSDMRILSYIAVDCYMPNGSLNIRVSGKSWMRTNSNFPFSHTKNKFTAVGCDTSATILDPNRMTGCISSCSRQANVEDGVCAGSGCCQTSIPSGIINLNITIQSYFNHTTVWGFNPCSFSFVAASDFYNFSVADLYYNNLRETNLVPSMLDWSIGSQTCEEAQMNLTSYVCSTNSICSNFTDGPGYNCHCSPGFHGNPYFPNGCQDVDECTDSRHLCVNNSTCINTVGNYTCSCRKGFRGDGRQDGNGCEDINECLDQNIHGCDGECINTDGGYSCSSTANNLLPTYISVGVVASVVVLLTGSAIGYWIWRKRKYIKLKEDFFEKNGGFLLQQLVDQNEMSSNMIKIFTAEELQIATNNYDRSLIAGRGGYGTVYKGTLLDGSLVAIKKSNQTNVSVDEEQVKQFIGEVAILCQVNNRNIVHLRGCCFETPTPILVYEFVSNGTLSEHLHKKRTLSMGIRLRIATQIARVLSYLHSEAVIPIIHRDIKSTNILLDENFNPKVADFGASRLVASADEMQVCTMVQGTLGYLDPQYMQTGELTDKSDVYSFGVMLVELITGRKAVCFDKPETERNLANYFLFALKENRLIEVLDGQAVEEGTKEMLNEVAHIAKRCLSLIGEERPSMKQVAVELEGLVDFGLGGYSSPWVVPKIHSEKDYVHLLGDGVEEYSDRVVSTSYDTTRGQVLRTFPPDGR